jgi:hypothetical protein
MITQVDVARIEALRENVFAHIKRSLEECGHCKSYEGRINICLPNYFMQDDEEGWSLELHCYLIEPSRHYEWKGASLSECITKAEKDIDHWTHPEYQA